ncbi:hypothetical protein HCUR_00066 [Holospora curviuscula]|uniref:Uncharacterized protein n=1 Tax=Holospora curviuscula TaxID=1082868 RepID=A0A2S5RHV6_9PROT|nr:hypothetical protein HCUR_00066 [Holospora curviuscula]
MYVHVNDIRCFCHAFKRLNVTHTKQYSSVKDQIKCFFYFYALVFSNTRLLYINILLKGKHCSGKHDRKASISLFT